MNRASDAHLAREPPFDERVEALTERLDPFMAWLGVVFALLVGYELTVDLTDSTARALEIAGWSIWAVFLAEFVAKVWLAPVKADFLRRHWLQIVMLALPVLRVLRFLRLLRLGRALPASRVISSSFRTVGTTKRLLRSRLGYLAGVSLIVAIALAELVYLFERDADGGFRSFGDALVWSFSTILAQQADPVPEGAGGRLVMLVGFAFGIVFVASLAGTVGAFLVDERRERDERRQASRPSLRTTRAGA